MTTEKKQSIIMIFKSHMNCMVTHFQGPLLGACMSGYPDKCHLKWGGKQIKCPHPWGPCLKLTFYTDLDLTA